MKIVSITRNNLHKTVSSIKKGHLDFDPRAVSTAEKIVKEVRTDGDRALFKYTRRFDKFRVTSRTVKVSKKEIKNAVGNTPKNILQGLRFAAGRVAAYQKKMLPRPGSYRDSLGNVLGWELRPIDKAGIYVPGGKASYPSTVIMTAIPAKVAGVKDISIVTPSPGGEINPAVLAAADICGVDKIYKVGGAQAVAALAYGTKSVEKVDKIVGPGNIYVTIAKKLVYGAVHIDSLAGPTEVLVIADGTCPASWVAADLLAQAEHDELATANLITTKKSFADEVRKEVSIQLKSAKRKKIAGVSIKNNSTIYVTGSMNIAAELASAIAPEHLELCVKSPKYLLKKIRHAGAVFLGPMSTEAFGDYISGPSHVLPTGGAARFSSPLSVYDFLTMPSTINMSKKGFKALSKQVMNLAYSEGLEAHALSVKVRLKD